MKASKSLLNLLLALGLLCAVHPLHAADLLLINNYDSIPIGSRSSLQAGAMLARATEAESTWNNPAGLTKINRPSLSGSASLYSYENRVINDGAANNQLATTSSFLGGGYKVENDSNLAFGYCIAIPRHSSSTSVETGLNQKQWLNWDWDQQGSELVDVSYDQQTSGSTETLSIGGAIAYRFNSFIQAGLAVRQYNQKDVLITNGYAISQGSSQYTKTATYTDIISLSDIRAELGLQGQMGDNFVWGLVYKPELKMTGQGKLNFSENYAYRIKENNKRFMVNVLSWVPQPDIASSYVLPTETHLGVGWVTPEFEFELDLRTFGQISAYQSYASFDVNKYESYSDVGSVLNTYKAAAGSASAEAVTNIALGGQASLTEEAVLMLGYATDNSPKLKGTSRIDLERVSMGMLLKGENLESLYGISYVSGISPSDSPAKLSYTAINAIVGASLYF